MSGRDRNVNEVTVSSDYQVPVDMDYVFCEGMSGDVTITLKRTKDRLLRSHRVQNSDGTGVVTVTDGASLSYPLSAAGEAAIFEIDKDGDFHVFAANALGTSGGLMIPAGGSITYSPTEYADDGSFQPIGPDLNLDPAAGTSDVGDSSYLATIMGNIIGDTLTKTKNIIAGVIGKLSVIGTRASTYPVAGVVAEVGDGVTEADGGFVAVLGGDSEQTNARAAYSVDNQNSTPGSGFDYGLDLLGVDHDGYGPVAYLQGDIRFSDGTVQSTAGGNSYEVPTGDVDGVNDEFTFTKPPILIFRNGVMERRLGSIATNVFTFDAPPDIGDDIEGLI